MMQSVCTRGFLIPADRRDSIQAKLKRYTLNGSFALVACVLMYRDWATTESLTPEIAFRIVPYYVQILITLLESTTQHIIIHCHTSGDCRTLSGWFYWAVTFICLFSSNWLRLMHRDGISVNPENILQICLGFIPLLSEINFCRMCTEFKKCHHNLNKLVTDGCITTAKLSAIREQRKALIDRAAETTGGGAFGAQILLEIGTTAATTVFEVHRLLLSTERSSPAADLLDVTQRFLRLFALCKVSGNVAKEANKLVTILLDINPSADIHLEDEISFFLWEIDNPPTEMCLAYGTLALGPRLFVSVFSWCVGFILILLQFRWPRTVKNSLSMKTILMKIDHDNEFQYLENHPVQMINDAEGLPSTFMGNNTNQLTE
ncbi:hypothetical protein QTP88_018088 [Uroleucon formosanum]